MNAMVSIREGALGLWLSVTTSYHTLRDGFLITDSQALRAGTSASSVEPLRSLNPSGTKSDNYNCLVGSELIVLSTSRSATR
jgi:hypothetical protein